MKYCRLQNKTVLLIQYEKKKKLKIFLHFLINGYYQRLFIYIILFLLILSYKKLFLSFYDKNYNKFLKIESL